MFEGRFQFGACAIDDVAIGSQFVISQISWDAPMVCDTIPCRDIRERVLYPTASLERLRGMYNCSKCPGFCCSYEIIPLTKRDLERIANHFDLPFRDAKKKFTVPRDDEKYTMRRKADPHFGKICQFFDIEARRCTIYGARPSTCRGYPGGRCGYYDFLSSERRIQDDPEHIASTWSP